MLRRLLATLAIGFAFREGLAQQVNLTHAVSKADELFGEGGEIVAYTPHEFTVAATLNDGTRRGVQILALTPAGELKKRGVAVFDEPFGKRESGEVTSTALDPMGRGFGAAVIIPADSGQTRGVVGFYDYRRKDSDAERAIKTLDVGYHPDSILFSPDGALLFIANEGEFTVGGARDAPGAISIIDLAGVHGVADLERLKASDVVEIDFSASNFMSGVDLKSVRVNDASHEASAHRDKHVEPEFMSLSGNRLYVSLQENNAIGVLELNRENLRKSKWRSIHNLGMIANTIDASKHDGPNGGSAVRIDDLVFGLPMPDNIATFSRGSRIYLVSANEGDYRPDNGDRARVYDFNGQEDVAREIDQSAGGLGSLRISSVDSDMDGDGLLDAPVTAGTRSISIWNAETGDLIADTGSLEFILHQFDPGSHNIEEGDIDSFDERSDDKGPEPEAVAVGEVDGRLYVFAAMERQNGILTIDVTNPLAPKAVGYANSLNQGLISPESIVFIAQEDSPTKSHLLLVGYEGSGGGVGVYSMLPDAISNCRERDNECGSSCVERIDKLEKRH